MDVVSAPRPAIFSSYSSSLQDLRSLANALPRNLDHDPLYAATALYASNVLPLHSHGASCDADELSSPPPLSFPQRMPPLPLQRFDSPRVVSESTATSSNPAQASQPSPPTGDSGHSSSYVTQQAQSSTSSFPVTSTFSRMQAASFNSSNAFPPSPHSAYSNSPNTPLGFGHASPAVASPALDSRMIQQGSYISSYGHSQSYGTPVTAQFPVPGGCTPLEPAQQQSGYYPGSNVSHGGHHGGMHRKSSSAGSSAGLSDALGLHHASYSNMSTDDASGVTHSPVLFGSPRVAEPQPDHTRLAGSPVFAPMRRPSTAPRRASLGFSPKLARSPFHTASSSFGPSSSSPQAVGASPMSEHLIIPPSHSPHIQNALLPLGVRTDALMGSPSMVHATTHSPRMSFSNPTSPPSITPPSGVGLRLSPSPPPPHSITIIRPKAPRKPKKMLPTPEPGLVKASRGRAVPTQVELMDTGVWDGDIAAAHNKSRIRERVKMRQNARAHAEAAATISPEGDAPGGAVWDGHDHGDGNAGENANREMPSGDARDGMPTIHVVSPRSYVCPVSTCSKAFKRREHLRRHLRSIHTNEKPHKCPHAGCTKSFSRTDNLWQHVKTHEVSGSGYHDVSPETGLDAQTHNDTGDGWQDHLAGSAGDTPLLHNSSMLDTSSNTGFGGGYPQFAPVHYEYSDIRQQQPDSANQHPHFVQHGMPSHPMQQQHNLWGNMQQGPSSNFAHDQPSYSANSSSKLFGDNGQQSYPHGRM